MSFNSALPSPSLGFPGGTVVKKPQEIRVRFLDWEDSLEEEIATHFSILTWKMPWTEKPGRL